MNHRRRLPASVSLPGAAVLAALIVWHGCLPIPRTVTLSPVLTGTVQLPDGTALPGAPLALSTLHGDSTCAAAALRTVTDAEGRFVFAATRERERWTPILFERLLCYHLCGGDTAAEPRHRGCYLHRVPAADSVACMGVEDPAGGGRIRCAPPGARSRRDAAPAPPPVPDHGMTRPTRSE